MSKWATFSGHHGGMTKPTLIITNAPGLSVPWLKSVKLGKWVKKMALCLASVCQAQAITLANPCGKGFQCGMMNQAWELQAIAALTASNPLQRLETKNCLQHPIGRHTHECPTISTISKCKCSSHMGLFAMPQAIKPSKYKRWWVCKWAG